MLNFKHRFGVLSNFSSFDIDVLENFHNASSFIFFIKYFTTSGILRLYRNDAEKYGKILYTVLPFFSFSRKAVTKEVYMGRINLMTGIFGDQATLECFWRRNIILNMRITISRRLRN